MKKLISICFLWVFSLALWGQTKNGYGGGFDPTNPANPLEPSATMKYSLKVTTEKGGYVHVAPSGSEFVAGASIYLNANPNSGYTFKCWLQGDSVLSTSQWHYYTMPAKDVEVKAVFAFEPEVPSNPDVIPLDYRVTAEASPSRGGNVWYSNEEVKVGTYTNVSANANSGYRFKGWLLDGILVSTDSYYGFEMQSRNMHFVAKFEFNPDVPGNPSNNPDNAATYTLSYSIDGQICYSEQLPAGATITTIAIPAKKGHTFSGWSNVPTLMPAKDLTISGNFTPNKYHVVYKVEDKIIHEEDVDYGAALTPPTGEAREGHTLTWKNLPTAMPDYEVVVEGFYSPNVYKLTYMVDGSVYKSFDVVYATSVTPEAEPSKEGHTFSGWSEIPETMPAKDVTVTGSFTVNSYTLTYIVDGAEYKKEAVAYGTRLTASEAPTKEGHTFSGWSEIPETMPAKDVTVTGSFTVNSYTLTYIVDGAEYKKETVAYGTKLTALESPTKEGHTFSGWSEIPENMPASDVIISGTFTINKYLVTFKIGDEVIAADSLEYGATIVAPEAPEKEGHTFDGWIEIPEVVPANDVTIEGSYSANSYLLSYTVDSETIQVDSVAYGTAITLLEEPEKEGHTFSGWSEAPETMPANDVIISGTFTVNKYLVAFKIDDEVIAADSLEYGTTIVAPEAPEKEGHTFEGWGEVAETVPASDVTYEGTYTVNIYKVYYYVGEELVHTAEVAYGEAIPEYVYEPTEEGYTFLGWVGDTYETMPAHDVTYTANIDNGIRQLTIDNGQLTIYDLTGRKVLDTENLKGGIYIVNGRKVIVK